MYIIIDIYWISLNKTLKKFDVPKFLLTNDLVGVGHSIYSGVACSVLYITRNNYFSNHSHSNNDDLNDEDNHYYNLILG